MFYSHVHRHTQDSTADSVIKWAAVYFSLLEGRHARVASPPTPHLPPPRNLRILFDFVISHFMEKDILRIAQLQTVGLTAAEFVPDT